jgi:ribosomal protein L11 methylase PrmA
MVAPERRLRVVLPDKISAEQLRALCDDTGALDVSFVEEMDATTLTARFASDRPGWLEDRVESWLDLVDPAAQSQLETALGDGDWQPGWRALYRGAEVGRFRIRPAWARNENHGSILIDPRGGFGSGLHPTSEVALRLLEACTPGREGQALLDVGTGTGLLSVAAARCGLKPTAIDSLARARHACERTAALNGVAVRVLEADLEQVEERFPVVIANMPTGVLLRLHRSLRAAVAPGGALLLSGPRAEDLPEVLSAFEAPDAKQVLSHDCEWAGAAVSPPAS